MSRWGINAPTLAQYILDKELPTRQLSKPTPKEPFVGLKDMRGKVQRGPGGWTSVADSPEETPLGCVMRQLPNFVFARKDVLGFEIKHGLATFKPSGDYSSACLGEKKFKFTPTQAHAIRLLHEAHQKGAAILRQDYILEEIESSQPTLRKVFKGKETDFDQLIVRAGKGLYRLNI